jgi:hypothetical protein
MELGETFAKYLGWSVNNELERLWKDVVVTGFDILSWHLSGTAKEDHENPVRIAPVPAKIQTGHLNTSLQCCYLS